MTDNIELEKTLWSAADKLRNPEIYPLLSCSPAELTSVSSPMQMETLYRITK